MNKKIITDITIRFRDIDSMGHVNNAVYFTYFEEGRKEFLRSLFNIVSPSEYNFILAHIRCDYLKPIRISDPISLHVWAMRQDKRNLTCSMQLSTEMTRLQSMQQVGQCRYFMTTRRIHLCRSPLFPGQDIGIC